jgi:2-desacetyl-2-hydroxyethyl bacteriochlorophyllide A dehydrogenase
MIDVPEAPLAAGQVRVAAQYLGISIGTELNTYRGGVNWHSGRDPKTRLFYPETRPWEYPATLGYGHVGRVVEVGPDVANLRVGDVVYSTANHATHVVVGSANVWKVPDQLDPRPFVLLQLVKTALGVVQHARPTLGETVVVFGAGVVGLLTVQLLKRAGAGRIIVFEPIKPRREMAMVMGADLALDPADQDPGLAVRHHNQGRGADVAIEASASPVALRQCPRVVEPQGHVVLAAMYQRPVEIHLGQEAHFNAIRFSSAHVTRIPRDMHPLWDTARRDALARSLLSQLELLPLITHEFDFNEAPRVYQMLDEQPGELISALLRGPAT